LDFLVWYKEQLIVQEMSSKYCDETVRKEAEEIRGRGKEDIVEKKGEQLILSKRS